MNDTYWLVSTVRGRTNRTARALAPTRQKFKQFVLDGKVRLVRGRPVQVTNQVLNQHKAELKSLVDQHVLEIHLGTPDGPLHTFGAAAPEVKKVEPEKPHAHETIAEKLEDAKVSDEILIESGDYPEVVVEKSADEVKPEPEKPSVKKSTSKKGKR